MTKPIVTQIDKPLTAINPAQHHCARPRSTCMPPPATTGPLPCSTLPTVITRTPEARGVGRDAYASHDAPSVVPLASCCCSRRSRRTGRTVLAAL